MSRPPPQLSAGEATEDDIEQFLDDQRASKHGAPPSTQGSAAAAGGAKNVFAQTSNVPQKGKVLSVSRTEVFGQSRTTMKVLMDKGGERTVHADGSSIKVAPDVDVGDAVKLAQTGHMQMEWTKVIPRQST
jgi:hypothetical protein